MKITYSALINNLSGRSGGVVFSRWQGVRVGRVFTPPTQPRTAAQTGHRNLFRWLNRMYRLVTNSWVVASWVRSALAAPGIPRNFFMKANLDSIGQETNDNNFVPHYIQPEPTSAWVAAAAAGVSGQINLTWTTAPTPSLGGRVRSQIVATAWMSAAPRQESPAAALASANFAPDATSGSITGLAAGTYSVLICIAAGNAADSSASESQLTTNTVRLTATVT